MNFLQLQNCFIQIVVQKKIKSFLGIFEYHIRTRNTLKNIIYEK